MRLHCRSTNITLVVVIIVVIIIIVIIIIVIIVIRLIWGHNWLLLGYAVACHWCNNSYNQQSTKKNYYY